ncbi:exodeoxyribonuclease VII large subunit, partial [Dietzia aerolata]|nr:exodeoxyribonuclease VII large subunit [Dietzia aerolata]
SIADAPPGTQLRIRVSDGALSAAVLGATPAAGGPARRADPDPTSPTTEENS